MDFIFQFLDELFLEQNSDVNEGLDKSFDVETENNEILNDENFFSVMVFH